MSYQQPPDRSADTVGPPPGWYRDPGGLQAVRWWDGAQWTPHTQPLPGIREQAQPPYQDATAPAASGYAAYRQESAGQQGYGQQPHQPSFTPHTEPYEQRPYQPQGQPQNQPQPDSQEPSTSPRQRRHSSQQAPRKRRRVFLWVFLGIQALFIIWIIVGVATTHTGPTQAQLAQGCYNGNWYPLFKSQADCVQHYGGALQDAGNIGKGIGVALVIALWVAVDVILGIGYGIYRLARRSA